MIHYKLALSFQHDLNYIYIYIQYTYIYTEHFLCFITRVATLKTAPCAAGFSMDVEPQWVASPDSMISVFLDIFAVQGGPSPVFNWGYNSYK